MSASAVPRPYKNRELLARFLPYFSKYKYVLALDLFCAGLTTLCEMVLPLILRYIADTGAKDLSLLSFSMILRMAFLYLGLRVIDVIAQYYMANIGHVMGARIETDMRRDAFSHLQNLSDSFYNNTKVGQIMAHITTDLFDVTEFSHHCPEEFFIGGLKIFISFVILLGINPLLTGVLFAMIPLMIFFASQYNHLMRLAFKNQRSHIGDLNAGIEDSLLGVKVVKSFTNEDLEREKFEKSNQEFLGIKRASYRYLAGFQLVTRIFDGVMYLIVIVLGGLLVVQAKLSPGDLIAYTLYVSTLLQTVRRVVEFMEQFQRGMSGLERFTEIMDTDVDIFDEPAAQELKAVRGSIQLEGVSFSYPDHQEEVLQEVSVKVEPGQNVALVGPSGGGKTTLCNLIPRFYDVTQGRILIDGHDVRALTLKSLRSQIGMVQQDVYLFSGSVLQNIQYGRPGASFKEVQEAARLAGADDFIQKLPQGYDTYVGERGVKLSGGQKQRISIARVFLKNPPVLILDEATSALDNQSERVVQQSLEKLAKGRTTFTIAHRLSTIRNADLILVLDQGRIVERGTHQSLLAAQSLYYQLYTQANPETQWMA